MAKITLNHHASTVLAHCPDTHEFLLGQYDPGYPGKNRHWIGRVKLLGGNYFSGKDQDQSPHATLSREIQEEFSGEKAAAGEMSASQEHTFATRGDIEVVRTALLSIQPFQDYFLHQPGPEDKPQTYVVQSVFRAEISREVIECVKENLAKGKSLTNEGFLAVKNLDDLARGNPLAQGITGLVIGHATGTTLPHCLTDLFTYAPIGEPRASYEAYSDTFQYRDHSKK